MTTTHDEIRSALEGFLRERFPQFGATPIGDDTRLLAAEAIDSLGILELVTFLGERFGVSIGDEDFVPENFESFGELVRFVERVRS